VEAKMKLHKKEIWATVLFFLSFLAFPINSNATVGIAGSFYDSDNALSIYEIGEGADFGGSITLLPYSGFADYPFSIYSEGYGHPDGSPEQTRMSFQLTAHGNGKTVSARSGLRADPHIKSVVSSRWGHQATLGSTDGGECAFNQFLDIKSEPGYLTFPSLKSMESITAGMTFDAYDSSRNEWLEKRCIPTPEYGEYPLTLSVMKGAYDNVYMEHNLEMSAEW
jgi:hypothetical protein